MNYRSILGGQVLTISNWHGCIATDVDGLIVVNSTIPSFPSVYIVGDLHTSMRLRADTAATVVEFLGSYNVVGPKSEEK